MARAVRTIRTHLIPEIVAFDEITAVGSVGCIAPMHSSRTKLAKRSELPLGPTIVSALLHGDKRIPQRARYRSTTAPEGERPFVI